MPEIDTSATLADIVNQNPRLARELERRSLDYCCGGQRTLADACAEAGIDPDETAVALAGIEDATAPEWVGLGPADLADHIEGVHHAYLHSELPRLVTLADKVAGVHGDRHPELVQVRRVVLDLSAELQQHLAKEEEILFPMIRDLASTDAPLDFHCGSLQNPIRVMLMEHDDAGAALAALRQLTGDYTVPEDACGSYEALYRGLEELEADTHLHIHKENNILFPEVVGLEARIAQ